MALQQSELAQIEAMISASFQKMIPTIETMVNDAVAVVAPAPLKPVATFFLDEIDALVNAHVQSPTTTAAAAVPPEKTPDAPTQIATLQAHVAALTIATGAASSSSFQATKNAILVQQTAAAKAAGANADEPVTDAEVSAQAT
jgi:hypothetical protein